MKKTSLFLFGIIIGAFATYFFCPRQDFQQSEATKFKIPKDTISVAEAKILSNNWSNNNKIEIDSLLEVQGSKKKNRSVWWSMEVINDYLKYAAEKSDTLGYKMTGIRVYLGNYGNSRVPAKKNRNTMFIVPTGSKITSKASSLDVNISFKEYDIPAPPLNNGTGGDGGYPQ